MIFGTLFARGIRIILFTFKYDSLMRTFVLGLLLLCLPFLIPFVLAHYIVKIDDVLREE